MGATEFGWPMGRVYVSPGKDACASQEAWVWAQRPEIMLARSPGTRLAHMPGILPVMDTQQTWLERSRTEIPMWRIGVDPFLSQEGREARHIPVPRRERGQGRGTLTLT